MRTVGIHALLSSMGLLLCLPLVACTETHTYEGKAIQGQVVDAESKQALEGAVVVALWAKRGGLHTDTIGYVHLDEAVTDSEGRYELKAWGPVEVSGGYMGSFSPDLLVFKQGYKYWRNNEGFLPPAKQRRVWTSKWDGKVVELERLEGDIYDHRKNIRAVDSELYLVRYGEYCYWEKVPFLLSAIHKEGERIRNEAIRTRDERVELKSFYAAYHVKEVEFCGDAKEFFQEYLKNEKN